MTDNVGRLDPEELLEEFERTGDTGTLRAAIEVLRADGGSLVQLSYALLLLGEETADPAILDDAAATAERAQAGAPPGSSLYRAAGHNRALALWKKSELTGETQVLEQTVATLRAICMAGGDDPEVVWYTANLGLALRDLFGASGGRETLSEAISMLRHAESIGADHPDRPVISMNLALALQDWCEETGEAKALDEAIERVRSVIEEMPEGGAYEAQWASNLSAMYQDRYEMAFDLSALGEAVRWGRAAVDETPDEHPGFPALLTHLGVALRMLYEATGDLNCLGEAVRTCGKAVTLAGDAHPRIAIYESNYASALRFEYEHSGEPRLLDEAIEMADQAVRHTPPDHLRRAGYESNLSLALWTRYERSGHLESLNAAVAAGRAAVAATSEDQPDLARYRTNLGLALWTLADRDPGTGAMDEAIGLLRAVLDGTPAGHAERARFATNLSNALWARYRRGGRPADLSEAIGAATTSFELTPADHVDFATHAGNLGELLLEQASRNGQAGNSHQALSLLRAAVSAASAKDFDSALHLDNLAEALAGEPGADNADLAEALRYADQAASSPVAPVSIRIAAARTAARIAVRRGDPAAATARLSAAVSLLPDLIGQPLLDRPDQEHSLATVRGIAADAAAAALTAGDPAAAVSLLEQGRGVLLRGVTDPEADRRALRAAAPGLANRLGRLSVAPRTPSAALATGADGDRDRLLRQIRETPGLEHLFRVPDPVPLPAGLAGPVVIVNLTDQRCDALIIGSAGTDVVPLPGLRVPDAAEHAGLLRAAVRDLVQAGPSAQPAAEADLNDCLRHVLSWLAETIAAPVLDRLARHGGMPGRLWWSPVGPLAALPLHAAAQPLAPDAAMSYTPTLRSLALAHARSAVPGQAVVIDPADDLPSASREVAAVLAHYPQALVLSGQQATHEAVTAAMPSAAVIHACAHAFADPVQPSLGFIELADRDLTIDEISRLSLPRAWLIYLSACSTAEGSDLLPDEALTLATAFGVAGCPHVVASLWPIADDIAAQAAELCHASLASGQPPAGALRLATAQLRAEYPARPGLWAPFVHLGP